MRFTTRPPLKFFVWILISLSFTIYLLINGMVFWGAIIYGILGIVELYWAVSNKDCRMTLHANALEIGFHRTFWTKHRFSLNDVDALEFVKGDPFWKLIFVTSKMERYYRAQDKLLLISGETQREILINTNRTDLRMLIDHFNRSNTKSPSPGGTPDSISKPLTAANPYST